jgi:hypothetical protein
MTFKISQHEVLHEKAQSRAKTFHRAEADLIDVLQELDEAKTFLHYRCTSLFDYCLKYLKLSPAVTANFINVSRKAKEVPSLKEAIRNQEITVCKARKIAPVLTKENSQTWLEKAKSMPKLQLEKEVAKAAPKTLTPEKARYVTEDRILISLGVSEGTMKKYRRAQDLECQRTRGSVSLEATLEALLDNYLQKNDPVIKAERLAKEPSNQCVPGTRSLAAQTKHQVNLRDQGQCTHIQDGRRCENKKWVETHHQIPLSKGGTNDLNNLRTLCWAHHRMQHAH